MTPETGGPLHPQLLLTFQQTLPDSPDTPLLVLLPTVCDYILLTIGLEVNQYEIDIYVKNKHFIFHSPVTF